MDRRQINPWSWQDRLGFSQAWRVDYAETLVFLSGQTPLAADGTLVGAGDFTAQARQVFENLATVLEDCGATFAAVVRLTVYLTDMSRIAEYREIKAQYIQGPQPASTAVGVSALAIPGMMIEVEATAVL